MSTIFPFLLILFVLILGVGFWWTLQLAKKQKNYTEDEVNPAISKHTVLLNPAFWAYIGFSVVCIVIVYIAFFVY